MMRNDRLIKDIGLIIHYYKKEISENDKDYSRDLIKELENIREKLYYKKDVIYYIDTQNRHGQFLVFKEYNDAFDWMKKATRLGNDEIKKQIHESDYFCGEYYNVFPEYVMNPEEV